MSPHAPPGYKLERKWSLTHFLIGVFGAAAILGVMAKVFNFEAEIFGYLVTWKPIVLIGFIGEAIVFILMGMMQELKYVPVDEEDASAEASSLGGDLKMDSELLGEAGEQLTREAEALARELQSVREALARQQQIYEELSALHGVLQDASSGLATHVEALEGNMDVLRSTYEEERPIANELLEIRSDLAVSSKELHAELEEARTAVHSMHSEIASAAQRFAEFNRPGEGLNGRPD